MRSAADDTVSGIIEKWSASFNKLDAGALASLYSRNALFFGSNPTLYRGQEGVTTYFNALPRWSSPTVQFTDVVTAPVGSDVINVAGTASFLLEGASTLSVKITWVIVREDDDWKIISHHVSSKVALI
jgi:ketosteroid isomerase-like protein